MNLEEARHQAVENELRAYRARHIYVLFRVLALVISTGLLLYIGLQPPAQWARGEFFQPGGWLYENLGYDNGVLMVRLLMGMGFGGSVFWLLRIAYSITLGLPAQRARIVEEFIRYRDNR